MELDNFCCGSHLGTALYADSKWFAYSWNRDSSPLKYIPKLCTQYSSCNKALGLYVVYWAQSSQICFERSLCFGFLISATNPVGFESGYRLYFEVAAPLCLSLFLELKAYLQWVKLIKKNKNRNLVVAASNTSKVADVAAASGETITDSFKVMMLPIEICLKGERVKAKDNQEVPMDDSSDGEEPDKESDAASRILGEDDPDSTQGVQ
ncbi:hypothetical protein Acr_22g0003150 [Actinidia rufa]|uniref:Uncharacterized protein n=1 Tax=Actinidia rufa TaxID=165716 RepID=A0A7J0GJD0_9ERIC|nr:hypothetical protein Acr_22g0003150 [Actinidia rufa]